MVNTPLLELASKLLVSSEEIDIQFSTYLKVKANKSKRGAESISRENLLALGPEDDKGFFANVCEPENFKGMFYVCKEPCYFVGVDNSNKDTWKIVHSRRICEKAGKAGVCRRAIVRVTYC